jgi:hypothetical protein
LYELEVTPEVTAAIAALPTRVLPALGEVFDVLKIAPWNGPPYNKNNPDGAMRHWAFGPEDVGDIVYVILERARRVELVLMTWFGD